MREYEEFECVCIQRGSRDWIMRVTCDWHSLTCHTCEAWRKLKGDDSWSTTGQKGQSGLTVILQLKLATHPSSE